MIRKELSAYTYPEEQIEIVNATEVIETAEPPVKAIRGKKIHPLCCDEDGEERGKRDALYLQEVQELFLLEDRFL